MPRNHPTLNEKTLKLAKTALLFSSCVAVFFQPFKTLAQSGTVKDTDGNTYKTVSINNRVWMAENLRTTKLNNGEAIKVITVGQKETTSGMYWYDNNKNSANSKVYGALYNWAVVQTQKVCPVGWSVATLDDWTGMIKLYPISKQNEKDGKYAGYNLRDKGNAYWGNNNLATNASGFAALPGGWISNNGDFRFVGERGAWWSPYQNSQKPAFAKIASADDGVWTDDASTIDILSIRCIKDLDAPASTSPSTGSTAMFDPKTVQSKIMALQPKYPAGITWTDQTHKYEWKGGDWPNGIYTSGTGCLAFAFILSDAAFGDQKSRKHTNINDIKIGDIVRINSDTHSMVVIDKDASSFTFADGNVGGKVRWGAKMTMAELKPIFSYVYTRYPQN